MQDNQDDPQTVVHPIYQNIKISKYGMKRTRAIFIAEVVRGELKCIKYWLILKGECYSVIICRGGGTGIRAWLRTMSHFLG